METHFATLLTDIFLHAYGNSLYKTLSMLKNYKDKAFNLTFGYIDDFMSIDNPNFDNLIPLIH